MTRRDDRPARQLPAGQPIPLRDLDGDVRELDFGPGLRLHFLTFLCPLCPQDGRDAHYVGVPFSDSPSHEIERPDDRPLQIWERTAGQGPEDLTLQPEIVPSYGPGCGLRGRVEAGCWR